MPLTLKGSTSGGVTIDVPAIAGNNTLTFPAATGTALIGTTTTANQVFFGGATSGTLSQDSSLFWDNTNKRLGIGTVSPGQTLNVSSSANNMVARFWGTSYGLTFNSDASSGFRIEATDPTGFGSYQKLTISGSSLSFNIANSPAMTLDASGNLGVGETSPSTYGKLAVIGTGYFSGGLRINGALSGSGTLIVGATTKATLASNAIYISTTDAGNRLNGFMSLETNPTASSRYLSIGCVEDGIAWRDVAIAASGGNVGIGTNSPTSRLTVQATTNYSDIYGLIQAYNSATGDSNNASVTVKSHSGTSQFMQWEAYGLRFGSRQRTNNGAGHLIFTFSNDTEGMRLNNEGNLLTGGKQTSTANSGDIQVSRGIGFPATQVACSDANTLDDYEENTYSPTVTSASGSITSYTSTGAYTKIGRQVFFNAVVTITNNGTGASAVVVSLPFTTSSGNASVGAGRENALTGFMLQVFISTSATTCTVLTYNNNYPGGTNASLIISGSYFV